MRWLRRPIGTPMPSVTFIEVEVTGRNCGVWLQINISVARKKLIQLGQALIATRGRAPGR